MILYMYIARSRGRQPPGDKILMLTERPYHFTHLLQVSKKSLWNLILYNFFHDLIHVYSTRAGVDSHQGTKFWCQQKCLVISFICCKFKKKMSLKSDFIELFHDLIYVYSPYAGADSPQGTKFWCQQKGLIFTHLLQVSKKSLWNLILYNYLIWFNTCIKPQGRGRQPPGDKVLMSTEMSCHFIHLLQVSKKCLWSLIFHDLIHVYSPRAGADSPQGTKFWCQQKGLITLPICCKFQRNLFEVWFYTIFFMIQYMYIAPGLGAYSPQGTKFWCQQKLLVTSVICC